MLLQREGRVDIPLDSPMGKHLAVAEPVFIQDSRQPRLILVVKWLSGRSAKNDGLSTHAADLAAAA